MLESGAGAPASQSGRQQPAIHVRVTRRFCRSPTLAPLAVPMVAPFFLFVTLHDHVAMDCSVGASRNTTAIAFVFPSRSRDRSLDHCPSHPSTLRHKTVQYSLPSQLPTHAPLPNFAPFLTSWPLISHKGWHYVHNMNIISIRIPLIPISILANTAMIREVETNMDLYIRPPCSSREGSHYSTS
ncbi:hypothetical protein BGY98DRAFT_287071 [Russula aff. rugulosa BPL654]|nr:hypothetical protein BGY98DRAFT_287071 [Russula aff. rugulosa BPL654]